MEHGNCYKPGDSLRRPTFFTNLSFDYGHTRHVSTVNWPKERSLNFCGFQLGFQGGGERVISYLHFGCDHVTADLLAWTTQASCPTSLKVYVCPWISIATLKWDYQHMYQNALKEYGAELQHVEVLLLVIQVNLDPAVDPTLVAKENLVKPSLVCREMVDEFAHPKFFASVRGMEHDQLFTEFNVGAARQMSLSTEVRMRVKYNVKEMRRLKSVVEKQDEMLKIRDIKIENLKAQLVLKEAEAAEAICLHAQTSNFEAVEKSLQDEVCALKEGNIILEKERNALDVKVTYLEASVVGKEHELTDLNARLTFAKSQNDNLVDRRWLLTHGLKLVIVKCLNSSEYLMALGGAISRAIEKGMQNGLAANIDHGKEGQSLADVVAYNLDAEAYFNFALQKFHEVDFPLLTELKSYKDASIRRYHELASPGRSEDQVVLGETSLSFALGVSQSRVERIRENIAAQRSTLLGVWTPLSKPLSVSSLIGKASTFGMVSASPTATTALSTTFASAISIPPISTDDYEIAG
ncbi:hypothetical protein Tco_0274043 [Tanacetum coccineum]